MRIKLENVSGIFLMVSKVRVLRVPVHYFVDFRGKHITEIMGQSFCSAIYCCVMGHAGFISCHGVARAEDKSYFYDSAISVDIKR